MIITDKETIAEEYIRIFKIDGVMADYADLERVVEKYDIECLIECSCSEEGMNELTNDLQQFSPQEALVFVIKIDVGSSEELAKVTRFYGDIMCAISSHNERHDNLFAGFGKETPSDILVKLFVFDPQQEGKDNYYYQQLTMFKEQMKVENRNLLQTFEFPQTLKTVHI